MRGLLKNKVTMLSHVWILMCLNVKCNRHVKTGWDQPKDRHTDQGDRAEVRYKLRHPPSLTSESENAKVSRYRRHRL